MIAMMIIILPLFINIKINLTFTPKIRMKPQKIPNNQSNLEKEK